MDKFLSILAGPVKRKRAGIKSKMKTNVGMHTIRPVIHNLPIKDSGLPYFIAK